MHVVRDTNSDIIAYKACPMTIEDPCVAGNVELEVTVDENWMDNYLHADNTNVPMYTSLNMKFINEENFD